MNTRCITHTHTYALQTLHKCSCKYCVVYMYKAVNGPYSRPRAIYVFLYVDVGNLIFVVVVRHLIKLTYG